MVKRNLLILVVLLSMVLVALPAFAEGNITVTDRNIFLFINQGQIGMWERISYENPNGESLKVIIPKGATQIQGSDSKGALGLKSEDMKETSDGLELSITVPQGNDYVELNYAVKPEGNIFDFITSINYPTKKFTFVSGGNIAVSGPRIAQGQPKQSGDMKLIDFAVTGTLNIGDKIEARLDAAPADLNPAAQQGTAQQEEQQPAQEETAAAQGAALNQPYNPEFHNPGHIRLWNTSVFKKLDPHLFTALLVIIPVGLIAFYVISRRKEKMLETVDVEELAFQKLMTKQKEILEKIVELDEKYETGNVEEEEYNTLRDNYKHRLLQIKAHLQKFSD